MDCRKGYPRFNWRKYSVFPNLGTKVPAHTITKITTTDGQVLAEAKFQPVSVMLPETAHAMTELLIDVVREGTGKNAAMNRPVAGKTGTTQLPQNKQFAGITGGSKDAWFVATRQNWSGQFGLVMTIRIANIT